MQVDLIESRFVTSLRHHRLQFGEYKDSASVLWHTYVSMSIRHHNCGPERRLHDFSYSDYIEVNTASIVQTIYSTKLNLIKRNKFLSGTKMYPRESKMFCDLRVIFYQRKFLRLVTIIAADRYVL